MLVYKQTSAPVALPVTLDEAKEQLNIETAFADDDSLITSIIKAAGLYVEKIIQGPLMTQQWEIQSDLWTSSSRTWPNRGSNEIEIHKARITAVGSVKYSDANNAEQTVDPGDYQQDLSSVPARIIFNDNFTYPTLYNRFDAVRVAITAGYADSTVVPEDLKRWIKVLISQMYESRDDSQVKPETEQMIRENLMAYAEWL